MNEPDRKTAIVADATDHGLSGLLSRMDIRALTARTAAEALMLAHRYPADMAFVDVMLPGADVHALLRSLQHLSGGVRPGCVLTCIAGFPVIANAIPVLTRPYRCEDIRSLLPELLPEARLPDSALQKRIDSLLDRLGIPQHSGRTYLSSAIAMTVNDSRLSAQLSRRIYPAIAARCGATCAQVGRAVRHCIDSAWQYGSAEEQYRLFGNTIDAQRGKPSVGQMIARSADILRLEETL